MFHAEDGGCLRDFARHADWKFHSAFAAAEWNFNDFPKKEKEKKKCNFVTLSIFE